MSELPDGVVTFLLTDVQGSTKLWQDHPEPMRAALSRHDALAAELVEKHGGVLVKSRGEGDSLFTVFARATDAVACACALQRRFLIERWPEETHLSVRMAIHTGEADLRGGDYYGTTVNRCARLRALASGDQILVSQATREIVGDGQGVDFMHKGLIKLRSLDREENIFQLLHPELPLQFPDLAALTEVPNNLPGQVTSFIGRVKEIRESLRLLAKTRMLTLTGSGGVGKTRMALQVAVEMLDEKPDGVWLVELAPLTDPGLVPQTAATALGVREEPGRPLTETLVDHLRGKNALIVLDNCEHMLDACVDLLYPRAGYGLLKSCPKLHIIATSREGLNIAGETTYRLPSLGLPDPKETVTPEKLGQVESVRLFLERARAAQPSFEITTANAPAVAQLCTRLDGIPLAIELAAARVKAMSVEQIAARLDDRFRLLTGGSRTALPRQQTLRALIDWSYEMLSEKEKTLLNRLSVFAGGWTLEAAEAVCADPIDDAPLSPAGAKA